MFLATTTANTYRGTTTNGPGDEIDNNTAGGLVGAAWPISIIERERRVQDPASGTWRTVRYAVGRLRYGRDVEIGDRVKDLTTLATYIVDEVNRAPRTISGTNELLLDLRITGNTAP